jgi:methylenetetrahydrofolate dehydrogenase (NADP+)/methenyltetrahydrofolate cyclohydrolase
MALPASHGNVGGPKPIPHFPRWTSPAVPREAAIHSRAVTARLIDGKAVARQIEQEVVEGIARLGVRPGLVAVRVGNDPASEIYVRNKAKKARELGLEGTELVFPESMSETELLGEVDRLNCDDSIDGILVQLPLPAHIDPKKVIDAIAPAKDVDGFHPVSVGMLHLGRPVLVPCTPAGVIRLIESTGETIEGKQAVVIGRSDIVGKPMGALLLQRNATVTICHSRTKDLAGVARGADILVAAIGRPILVTDDFVKPGAIVIDVGMNRVGPEFAPKLAHDAEKSRLLEKNGSVLLGDVDFARVQERAGWITPVPGGVGPMTIAMLMKNTVTAAERRRQ